MTLDFSPQALFRAEAAEALRCTWMGEIRIAQPVSHRLLSGVFGLLGLLLVLFLCFGTYTRREHTSGLLMPQAGLLEVRAPIAGTVTAAPKRQGDTVKFGDVMVSLTSGRSSAAIGDTAAAVGAQLNLQRSKVELDLANLDQLEQEQNRGLRNRIGLLDAQLKRLDAQLAIQNQQARSLQDLLQKIQPLRDKGFISALQVQQQEGAALDAQAQAEALARQRLEIEQQISSLHEQLRQLPLTTQAQRDELARKQAEIEQALAESEAQRASVLGAPSQGVIASMLVTPGQSVSAGETLLSIVPADSPLIAELFVPSRAIGFVHPNTTVALRYQAYPYQKFGLQMGKVLTVAASAMSTAQIAALLGGRCSNGRLT